MKISRRTTLSLLLASALRWLVPATAFAAQNRVRHILPSATAFGFGISVSTAEPCKRLELRVGEVTHAGKQQDSHGRFWAFQIAGLTPETTYQLQLEDEKGRVGSPWPLKTFPAPESMPESFRLLAFTCAGGPDGFGLPGRQFFKPHEFRQRLFDDALKEKPDAAVAIGDQIYWDLRGGKMPPVGRNSALIKLVAGWYLKLFYGAFDRGSPLIGTKNEAVLTRIGDEQIADLYGTRFRSVPMLFISDDHDYFENDDAEEEIVTFPPDAFSRAAYKAMADLYYPPLPDGPSAETDRSFGTLRYGKLFEAPIFDCAGHLSLEGENAGLVPPTVERWLLDRVKASEARHFALIPSHPLGWTAGKWREWYPDVLAPDGYTGVVARGLMDDGGTGRLTSKAQKFLWPKGWWNQHQRLLGALVRRPSSRFIFSGDIHAQGAIKILESGKDDFSDAPVCSVLVGPVSTSDATWPSAARGIAATEPDWLTTSEIAPTREVNGFTILDFSKDAATARLFDCGGFDRNLKEDGHVQSVQEFEIG